ncbi:Hypothetical protein SMAX5B_015384 [Scophthalmus maximus]|uniref:Uncharacterized protein n=1 Tax=Scophthalmus maximus TaxID=52904 RepID=A0A2U9BYP4_SCOMX|nr:Hypothetical protein SMAX5B_015384 [Scophthalmus maximus]
MPGDVSTRTSSFSSGCWCRVLGRRRTSVPPSAISTVGEPSGSLAEAVSLTPAERARKGETDGRRKEGIEEDRQKRGGQPEDKESRSDAIAVVRMRTYASR